MAWTEHRLLIDGEPAAYIETGPRDAPDVVVLLHAFPVGMHMWEAQTVPARWRAIAPALPGFDGTAPPPAASTEIDDYARAVLSLVEALNVKSFVLGGVSMGGYVVFGVLRRAESRCRAVALVDSRAAADSEPARRAREAMLALVQERGPSAVADDMVPKLLGETTHASRPEVLVRVRRLIEAQSTEGIAAAILRLRDRPDSTPVLSAIRVPTLIVTGAEDILIPPDESAAMCASVPGATLVTLPRAGHLPSLEDPPGFDRVLAQFLGSLDPAT
jgi:pimeloyl-ACP methyl ester carboxylesterase